MQQVKGELTDLGATIVAITPQLPAASNSLIEQQHLEFDLLSDPGTAYAAELGLRFTLPDDLNGHSPVPRPVGPIFRLIEARCKKFDRSRPVGSQNGAMLGRVAPKLAALP